MDQFEALLQGWGKAFGESGILEGYRKKAVVMKYALDDCFDMEDYMPGSFPAGIELLDKVPEDFILSYEEYGLDADGLPCYHRAVYEDGRSGYAGFYRYSAEVVEYVQFNVDSGVPYWFQRVVFAGGRKVESMRAVANGGGTYFGGMTAEQAIAEARRNEGSIVLQHRRYEYADGRIVKDLTHFRVPGGHKYSVEGQYTYGGDGQLLEINDVRSHGTEELRYCYWDASEGMEGLMARLVREMAEAIVDKLLEKNGEEPLALLELSYHYADVYWPILTWTTVGEKQEIVEDGQQSWESLFYNVDGPFDVRPEGFDRTFTQFSQQMKGMEGNDRSRAVLLKTAYLLTTTRLFGRIPTDEEFLAYAIDPTLDLHSTEDYKEIMLGCGMKAEVFEAWQQKGWMPD